MSLWRLDGGIGTEEAGAAKDDYSGWRHGMMPSKKFPPGIGVEVCVNCSCVWNVHLRATSPFQMNILFILFIFYLVAFIALCDSYGYVSEIGSMVSIRDEPINDVRPM
jgi:hypothetical protein